MENYQIMNHILLLLITNSHHRHQMSMFFPGIRSLEDWTHCAKLPPFHKTASITPSLQQLSVKPQSALDFFLCFYFFFHLLLPPSSHVCCVNYLCLPVDPNPTRLANCSMHDHLQRCLDRGDHHPFSVRFGIDRVLQCHAMATQKTYFNDGCEGGIMSKKVKYLW